MSQSTKLIFSWVIRILISALFLVSAYAKIYHDPSAYFSITTFEAKQLVPLGFDATFSAFLSRTLIGFEFTLGFLILLPYFLKRIVVPATIGMLAFFTVHLLIQIYLTGNQGNCGCFGALLPMTPLEAVIKNVIAMILLFLLNAFLNHDKDQFKKWSPLFISYIFITASIFIFIPIKSAEIKIGNYAIDTVEQTQIQGPDQSTSEFGVKFPYVDKGKVLLCFFAAGCDHCMSTIRSLDSLRTIYIDDFPKIEILFMEEETEKIPEFFEFAGSEYHYQILDIPTFYDVLTWERDTPGVFYIWNGNIQASYNGINDNAFNVTDLLEALDKKY